MPLANEAKLLEGGHLSLPEGHFDEAEIPERVGHLTSKTRPLTTTTIGLMPFMEFWVQQAGKWQILGWNIIPFEAI